MSRFKVVYTYPAEKTGMDLVREIAEIKVLREEFEKEIPEDELIDEIRDADALVNVRGVPTGKRVIEAGKCLKIIARHGVGYDCIDIEAATKHKILVTIALEEGPHPIAEHVIGFMIALSRKFNLATASIKEGKWEVHKMMGMELHGKTLGIIGLGRIGLTVAKMAKAFQMKIIAYDPYIPKEKATATDTEVSLVDLHTLLRESDYITIHTPLTRKTEGLIGEKEFNVMKNGVFIINAARGKIIDESALYNALIKGKVAGAGIDVFAKEPPAGNNPLLKLDNVILTPHVAGITRESAKRLSLSVAEDIINVLKSGLPRLEKIVNPSILNESPWKERMRQN